MFACLVVCRWQVHMVSSDEDHGRSRMSGAVDRGWSITGRVLRGWVIWRSGDAVCGLHHARGD
jgi:hypothetical protein